MNADESGTQQTEAGKGGGPTSRRRAKRMGSLASPAGPRAAPAGPRVFTLAAALLDEAGRAGLLDSETEHVSFRAPRVLVEAAKRETGLASTTELGLAALALLARPDPVSEAMKRTRGSLGAKHALEY